jgi:hypothetical protein
LSLILVIGGFVGLAAMIYIRHRLYA